MAELSIDDLTDEAALRVATRLSESWFKLEGWEAFTAVNPIDRKVVASKDAMPEWVIDPAASKSDAAGVAKLALKVVLEGDNTKAKEWVGAALREEEKPKGHALDPFTAIIGGVVLVSLVLAARVKKIDGKGVEFYEGLPEGLGDIIKTVAKPFLG
ncbi:MAG: hypothetical protein ACFCD0_13490 [Gemmataceae bacterium]